ncbi:carboxypeptidase S1 [Geopyxis carbonaria]|nr:carboxypeptidase S1 [Geopyxis carbonaria]
MIAITLSQIIITLTLSVHVDLTFAQFPPPVTGQKELRTPGNPNIIVRYKEPSNEICRTRNPDQKQYAGTIHLPPSTLDNVSQDYPINTFFWFVEAQNNPQDAPLTIWLNGGPGSSSMLGMMNEVGPCKAVPANKDSMTTVVRDYSWDGLSNMLFIDQPNKVGFSYDEPTNGSLPILDVNGEYLPGILAPPIEEQSNELMFRPRNDTLEASMEAIRSTHLMNGTFSSANAEGTANTTHIAAIAAWSFLQAWLKNFPQYNPNPTGVNLFAESYGGKYGPTFFEYFEKQNERRASGELSVDDTVEIHLESLGIINGCIDAEIQTIFWPRYANKNPYGIVGISDAVLETAEYGFYKSGGVLEQIRRCRKFQKYLDPDNFGNHPKVNRLCKKAKDSSDEVMELYQSSGLGFYDIAEDSRSHFPTPYYLEYLNNATVLEAIGSPVNFTESSAAVYNAFGRTGDIVRGGQLESIAYLLDAGVRVALIYGDRDYICNYQGGEAVSLAVRHVGNEAFREAGYEDIMIPDDPYIQGQVRQHGNFSFTRLYQAGHLVPAYQPQAAYNVFERVLKRRSISTGKEVDLSSYSTVGPSDSNVTLWALPSQDPTCFYRSLASCSDLEWGAVITNEAIIHNGVVYLDESDMSIEAEENSDRPREGGDDKPREGGDEKVSAVEGGSSHVETPRSLVALMVAVIFLVGLL